MISFIYKIAFAAETNIGGPASSAAQSSSPAQMIGQIYNLSLMIGGILAVGFVIWGGVRYIFNAGNPSGTSAAKDNIYNALIGLTLLLGAYIILNTINPNLTKLQMPELQQIPQGQGGQGGGGPISVGLGIANCPTCQKLPSSICKDQNSCTADPRMVSAIDCINKSQSNYQITEAYPPTVNHMSVAHTDGCAVDVKIIGGSVTCQQVKQFISSAQGCNLNTLNEYYTTCQGDGGTKPPSATGQNIHLSACR